MIKTNTAEKKSSNKTNKKFKCSKNSIMQMQLLYKMRATSKIICLSLKDSNLSEKMIVTIIVKEKSWMICKMGLSKVLRIKML
jgi:hypothetical protein